MKYGILAMIILFLASCSSPETEQSVRDQITAYKKEVNTLNQKITELEKKFDQQFQTVFTVLNELMTPPDPPRQSIGFHQ